MNARILVVEDDPALLTILEAAIAYGGFESHSVRTGLAAIEQLRAERFDAVLMDLGLPDIEGHDLLRSLRDMSSLPIIVVSGRATERDKIEALDRGADDYVEKPFMPGELLARIRVALRRYGRAEAAAGEELDDDGRPTRLGGLLLDPRASSATLAGTSISLTDSEYRILKTLALSRIAPVSRPALMDMLYGAEDARNAKIIEVYIGRIRTKLKELTGGIDLIDNQRGRGWFLYAP